MISKTAFALATVITGCVGLLAMAPANAQSPATSTLNDEIAQHHQLQYKLMKDMTDDMSRMTEQMSKGPLTPDQRTAMAKRMAVMSTIMRRMSGVEARPAHTRAQLQNQMEQMRKQMDDMTRDSRMAPAAK